ncbi:hypothetical protein VTJ49DRAFT_6100 [Mycothermus thermophilus]|uniref:Uncharacterized protein n=1 Tax=Humicola insolens TaxID=85995 RepID=A0ABR3V211_HUMIN
MAANNQMRQGCLQPGLNGPGPNPHQIISLRKRLVQETSDKAAKIGRVRKDVAIKLDEILPAAEAQVTVYDKLRDEIDTEREDIESKKANPGVGDWAPLAQRILRTGNTTLPRTRPARCGNTVNAPVVDHAVHEAINALCLSHDTSPTIISCRLAMDQVARILQSRWPAIEWPFDHKRRITHQASLSRTATVTDGDTATPDAEAVDTETLERVELGQMALASDPGLGVVYIFYCENRSILVADKRRCRWKGASTPYVEAPPGHQDLVFNIEEAGPGGIWCLQNWAQKMPWITKTQKHHESSPESRGASRRESSPGPRGVCAVNQLPDPLAPYASIPMFSGFQLEFIQALEIGVSHWGLTSLFPGLVAELLKVDLDRLAGLLGSVGSLSTPRDIFQIFHRIKRDVVASVVLGTVAFDTHESRSHGERLRGVSSDGAGIYILMPARQFRPSGHIHPP